MTAGRSERRRVKILRRGRHKTPSQVEKVAAQAGKAAPAMAIAGALVTAPQAAHAATAGNGSAVTAAHQSASAAKATLDAATRTAAGTDAAAETAASTAQHTAATLRTAAKQHTVAKALTQNTYYKVRSGDTLSKIAGDFYHKASDWQWLYHENDTRISDPNLIYPGQSLFVPVDPPANYSLPAYHTQHSKPATSSEIVTQSASTSDSSASTTSASTGDSAGSGSTSLSGTLGCSGLERLWEDAGGNPGAAVMAASIAMAESGGNQYALSPTDDYGYWQINASNGALATFNPYGNARAAITLSDNGTNWSPWTTYTSGAYAGRC
jgi:LysM repeat protein